jgi:hypothetical protein
MSDALSADARDRGKAVEIASVGAPFHYWAFISYSQHDAKWAKRLHEFLETYRIPRALVGRSVQGRTIPPRLMPVFRDRDELAGSPDLGATLHEALAQSGSLIVICSPHAATSHWVDEEVRSFKAMGRSARVFPLVVAGEPNASDQPGLAGEECFPRSVRREVTPDGVVTNRHSEPLAADARPDKDGWEDACLKLIAGILDLGFDDLRHREAIRERRRRLFRAATAVAGVLLAVIGYVALADADLPLPAGDAIRRQLDHYSITLSRPVMAEDDMRTVANSIRASLRRRLLADVATGQIEREQPISAWTIGEVVGAGVRDRGMTGDDFRKLLRLTGAIFLSPGSDQPDGHKLIETADDVGNPGRAEPILWTMMALSAALGRPEELAAGERATYERYLAIAQTVAQLFYPTKDGGWNTAARQLRPGSHFIYTTGLALHALLETRAANAGWLGDHGALDRMISDTATWLQGAFVIDSAHPGWRRNLDDDKPPDTGITLLVYSALGRACAQAGIAPGRIGDAASSAMADLRLRSYESADPDIRYDVRSFDRAGKVRTEVTITRMIWYGWAVQALASWRRCAARMDMPTETRRAIDRSLSHLLGDDAPAMLRDVLRPQRPLWINAETYYGIGIAPD